MIEPFIEKRFRGASLETIQRAIDICADYQRQGFNLTLRQLYYQFVARGLLANNDRNYKNLGGLVNDARLAGLMDWNFIQDRTRNVHGNFAGYRDPGHFIGSVANSYIEALWQGQHYRPEVWVEKEALADVVGQATADTRTPYFSCRGYVSQSEMYSAAKRFEERRDRGLTPIVIHLGDHDPSGIDMTRDIRERLTLMSWGSVEVRRIALNMDQIEEYNPPPNPAKVTDSRAEDYIRRFGSSSWELDALEPAMLVGLIQQTIAEYIDGPRWDDAVAHEQANEDRLRELSSRYDDLDAHWDRVLEVLDGDD